jgi:hypothetical protein
MLAKSKRIKLSDSITSESNAPEEKKPKVPLMERLNTSVGFTMAEMNQTFEDYS